MSHIRMTNLNFFSVICAIIVVFPVIAAEKKTLPTYGKNRPVPAGFRDLTGFENILPRRELEFKKIEASKPTKKAVATKTVQEPRKTSKKDQEKLRLFYQEKNKMFAEADAYVLEEKIFTEKELKYHRWLHDQWLSRQSSGGIEEEENGENCELTQLASVAEGEEELKDDEPKKRKTPTIPKKERIEKAVYKDDKERFIAYVAEKQVGLVWEMISHSENGKALRQNNPLADRLYKIRMNESTQGFLDKGVPHGSLIYVTMGMAKKAKPVNVNCIGSLLQYSTIKAIKKAQSSSREPLALHKPQCFGWEYNCNDYEKCPHFVMVSDSEYKRYTKVIISGDVLLKHEKTPFMRAVMHSNRAGCALRKYIETSPDYDTAHKKYKTVAEGTAEKSEAENMLMDTRKKLVQEWSQKNKRISRKELKKIYPIGNIDAQQQYSVSVTMPTLTALQARPALQPLVSMAPIRQEVTKNSYGHSPFQQLTF